MLYTHIHTHISYIHTQVELRALRTDTEQFRRTRPMGEEVLDFLHTCGLESFAMVFAHHDLDTLAMVAALSPEQVCMFVCMYVCCMYVCTCGLESFAMVFANHDLDTLAMVAALSPEQVCMFVCMYVCACGRSRYIHGNTYTHTHTYTQMAILNDEYEHIFPTYAHKAYTDSSA